MPRRTLTIDDAAAIAAALPGVTEGVSYGTRGWKVGRKFLMREKEKMDAVLVIGAGTLDERDLLLERDPEVFFITDHYGGWQVLLVRLSHISRRELAALIERAWRRSATRKQIAERDG